MSCKMTRSIDEATGNLGINAKVLVIDKLKHDLHYGYGSSSYRTKVRST